MATAPTIGDAVRAARFAVRLTLKDLADLTGISRRTFTRWEHDDTVPPNDARAKIVTAILRYDDAVGRRLAAQLGVQVSPPAAPVIAPRAPAAHDALATFEAEVFLAADALDLPPRRIRAAFAQLVLALRGSGATIDELAVSLTARTKAKARET